eukprot:46611-Rhodomonas_salina.1
MPCTSFATTSTHRAPVSAAASRVRWGVVTWARSVAGEGRGGEGRGRGEAGCPGAPSPRSPCIRALALSVPHSAQH